MIKTSCKVLSSPCVHAVGSANDRYLCTHGSGIHSVVLPWLRQMDAFCVAGGWALPVGMHAIILFWVSFEIFFPLLFSFHTADANVWQSDLKTLGMWYCLCACMPVSFFTFALFVDGDESKGVEIGEVNLQQECHVEHLVSSRPFKHRYSWCLWYMHFVGLSFPGCPLCCGLKYPCCCCMVRWREWGDCMCHSFDFPVPVPSSYPGCVTVGVCLCGSISPSCPLASFCTVCHPFLGNTLVCITESGVCSTVDIRWVMQLFLWLLIRLVLRVPLVTMCVDSWVSVTMVIREDLLISFLVRTSCHIDSHLCYVLV